VKITRFGERFSGSTGIVDLMEDLGAAGANPGSCMLGGGNPGTLPEVESHFRKRLHEIADDPVLFHSIAGCYDSPEGDVGFRSALAQLLSREFGWKVGPENIVLTHGSQTGFFILFNLLAGRLGDNSLRSILLPLAPEYIGYSDIGLESSIFKAEQPHIEYLDEGFFKYRVDFKRLKVTPETAAICVSRPTNPTGNVLSDSEIQQLSELAALNNIPLIIDSAYGTPFPNIIFSEASPLWNEQTIVFMSLSKLGLPGVRTGIMITNQEMVVRLGRANAIMHLANGSFGPGIIHPLVKSGEIVKISQELIRPYYQQRVKQAIQWVKSAFGKTPCLIHKPEGAIFLWLWFPDLPITSQELYQRLKTRGVLVIAGEHFFPGIDQPWRHRHECIRVTYSQDEASVQKGITIIADEVRKAYSG
jgi:valine--pyruvate aminotransferase|tara:strand:+ start:2917 stop:4167 length:1251 start_codon:yes stop_codon:yes gene_type:complete